VVVGGGPIGSALSLYLARAGREVLLLDAGASSRKICGEGLLPAAWEVLSDLGIAERLTQRGTIRGITYGLAGEFVSGALRKPAFGVQRSHLMQAFTEALAASTVEVWRGTRLQELTVLKDGLELSLRGAGGGVQRERCGFLVGADGLHSTVRRKAGLESARPRRFYRWGTRCYFRSRESREQVQVNLGPGLESYLTPLGAGLFGLAFLWSPQTLGRPLPGKGKVWERLLRLMGPGFLETLPSPLGDPWGDDRAIGPLQQGVVSPLHPGGRIALVGDAAGYLDALTGEGLCLGLRQARSLANCILEERLGDYPNEHRAIKRRHHYLVSGLLWLIQRPVLRKRVFRALLASPEQFAAVLGFAVEEAKWRTLLSPQLGRFIATLALP